jgi:peptidoglycan lytic transglycosylase A
MIIASESSRCDAVNDGRQSDSSQWYSGAHLNRAAVLQSAPRIAIPPRCRRSVAISLLTRRVRALKRNHFDLPALMGMRTDRGTAQAAQALHRGLFADLGSVIPSRAIVSSAIICIAIACSATACLTGAASAQTPQKLAGNQLEPVKWSELAGWADDDHLEAFAAYQASCQALRKRRNDDRAQLVGALSNVCRKAMDLQPRDSETARTFFEQNFQAVRIARLGEGGGLLTGYFEPVVAGSRFPGPEFSVPLYRRPRDLVAAGYKQGAIAFPNKGVRVGRRTEGNELVPYHDRGAIEAGALDGQKLEICWLRDPLDLLAIQIEGSGRVILEDGTPLRVSYDSHNGYSYSSFERVLTERNLIPRAEMSRERIRGWMAAHPEEAAKVRAANRAYAFFRITGLTNDGEPVGAQGVPLTPGRSIAVDRVHEYGTPFFIEATLPIDSAKSASPFRRLMIAQDTGSAIVGPARADLYLGAGDDAGRIANRIRHPGRFAMLLPREVDLAAAGAGMPLPVAKPKLAASEVAKLDDAAKHGDAAKQDGKGRAESANAAATTDGRSTPLPAAKPKLAALDAAKPDAKGKTNSASAGAAASRHPPVPAPTKIAALDIGKQDRKGKAESAATAAGKPVRLPVLKPKDADVKKADAKTQNARQQNVNDKKDKADSAWTVAGRQKPSPKQKLSETDVKKQNANGKTEPATSKLAVGKLAAGKLAAEKQTPSSSSKSKSSEAEARKSSGNEARKPDGKGKTEPATAGKLAGKPTPASASKSKTADTDVKKDARKPDGKGKPDSASAREDSKAATKPGRQADSARKSSRAVN